MEEFNMNISLEFPILLVDRDQMKRVKRISRKFPLFPGTENRGITIFGHRGSFACKVLSVQRCIVRDGNIEAQKSWKKSAKSVKPSDLEREVMHGICQVMGHFWRERYMSSNLTAGGNSESDHRLLKLLEMRKMPRYPYRIGFEKGMKAVEEYGMRFVLDEILSKGNFPSAHI
ncbi:hypothetical protein Tsubulata_012129 [Turnera subulata]|uniref:Uncharacterized protein n=1 Tax=Turnera subulata TaxID=218843 RepID=A0A9Q0FEB4_9ROSI|nr:hypothetical protein Tsubulata_012129 [Turnera subulata]